MLKKFLPQEENFFKYFQEISEQFLQAAKKLQEMVNGLSNVAQMANEISLIEQQSDKVAHATFELLHKTFITPFDRQDIHELTGCLDATLDKINLTARFFAIYQLEHVPERIINLVEIVARSAEFIQGAILQLKSLANTTEILRLCDAINMADDEAQRITLAGIEELFKSESDFKQLLKIRELYQHTSEIVEQCQLIANIIRGIVLEYA